MEECPVCEKERSDPSAICDCGYSPEKSEILDWGKARALIDSFRRSKLWVDEVLVKKRITDVQRKTHFRWPERETAKRLGERNNTTSPDIRLAEALDLYPELRLYKSKSLAQKRLRQLRNQDPEDYDFKGEGDHHFKTEEELRGFLADNWPMCSLANDWILKEVEYDTCSVGRIDLLAHHKSDKRWLIIELKLLRSGDESIGQLLRYMGWVELNYALIDDESVEGLIISESLDPGSFCALRCIENENIKFQKYRIQGKRLYLEEHNQAEAFLAVASSLPPDRQEKLWKVLKQQSLK